METDIFNIGALGVAVIVILNIVTLASSIFAIYRSFKLTPKEVAREDATASETYARSAALSDKSAQDLRVRVEVMEKEFELINRRYRHALDVLAEWARGIELLTYQMKNAKLTIVWSPQPEDVALYHEVKDKSSDEIGGEPSPAKKTSVKRTTKKDNTGV